MNDYRTYIHSDDLSGLRSLWIHTGFSQEELCVLEAVSRIEDFELVGLSDALDQGEQYEQQLSSWGIEVPIVSGSAESFFARAVEDVGVMDLVVLGAPSFLSHVSKYTLQDIDVLVMDPGKVITEEEGEYVTEYSEKSTEGFQKLMEAGHQRFLLDPQLAERFAGEERKALPIYLYHHPQAFVFEEKEIVFDPLMPKRFILRDGSDLFVAVQMNETHFSRWIQEYMGKYPDTQY